MVSLPLCFPLGRLWSMRLRHSFLMLGMSIISSEKITRLILNSIWRFLCESIDHSAVKVSTEQGKVSTLGLRVQSVLFLQSTIQGAHSPCRSCRSLKNPRSLSGALSLWILEIDVQSQSAQAKTGFLRYFWQLKTSQSWTVWEKISFVIPMSKHEESHAEHPTQTSSLDTNRSHWGLHWCTGQSETHLSADQLRKKSPKLFCVRMVIQMRLQGQQAMIITNFYQIKQLLCFRLSCAPLELKRRESRVLIGYKCEAVLSSWEAWILAQVVFCTMRWRTKYVQI